ncbi:MAG: biotin-dependent carboxyltransferase family protein [Planctomycetales bacterium]|nr:biotin-dependent carboxyltransferase family protein [Planctomycetales bacterium]
MSIQVLRPGLLTTVQDLGRWGQQRYGVVVGGAMDTFALRMANLLVGNEEGASALEMTLLGPTLRFEQDAVVALCGGEFRATVGDVPLPTWRPVFMEKGSVLTCGSANSGCRGYLAIAGGIDVPIVLGSRSTYLHGKFGGLEGRSLHEGDSLKIASSTLAVSRTPSSWRVGSVTPAYDDHPTLRVILGSEFDWLSSQSQEQLFHSEFIVTPQSDRMGYRLSGPQLHLQSPRELISEAVCPGVLQVPADGQPIVLMADCATTGGYPKAACVASIDLPLAAQLRPGDRLRFTAISLAEAQSLIRDREADIDRLKVGLSFKLSRRDHAADSASERVG